jgi:hypothetical protein
MRTLLAWIRSRLLPALVTAAGVGLLVAGLMTYQDPPEAVAVSPSAAPLPSAAASPPASLLPLGTLAPSASPAPSSGPVATRVATRVVVPALRIDLPVVKPPNDPDHFPYCNVAEYLPQLSQPGYPGTTYLYAHARKGMFLPLLETEGRKMLGMLVQVYTNDDQVYLYEIAQVLRKQTSLDIAFEATEEQLMLQTSEGPRGTIGKTMIIARPISVGPADPKLANPVAKPIACE